jgi:uncharacterized membrane protein
MNIHPLFVHFPIALLATYAVLELLSFKLDRRPYWFYIRAALVILGSLASIVSAITGDMAKDVIENSGVHNAIIPVHESFALAVVVIFLIPAIGYALAWLAREYAGFSEKFPRLVRSGQCFTQSGIRFIIAALGLAALIVTGALGGSIVYGPDSDPAIRLIYRLFFKS